MFVGVHSTALGPGFGGTRMKVYDAPEDALGDVLRLSAAMTFKNAMADLPFGGGKSVLAVPAIPRGDERTSLLQRYADFVAVARRELRDRVRHEHHRGGHGRGGGAMPARDGPKRRAPAVPAPRRPTPRSACSTGSAPSLAHAFGSDDPSGRTIVVEGAGAVGGPLCDLLADAGAKLVVSDIDPERARAVAERVGADVVDPLEAFDVPCDLFSPCATGAVLNADTIPRLRCRVVAGAANNQLAAPVDADRLAAAGILYAPDYVVNAGGVLHLAGYERLGWTADEMTARLAGIGDTLTQVFAAADLDGVTPQAAADRMANERIAIG